MVATFLGQQYGNIASVLGLALSLVGFYLTIQSAKRAERAAEQAQRAAGEAVARVGVQLFGSDVSHALQSIKESRDAGRLRNWSRAVDRCDEVRIRLSRLHMNRNLFEGELIRIPNLLDDLGLIIRHREALDRGRSAADMTDGDKRKMDNLLVFLGIIEGRLRNNMTEI